MIATERPLLHACAGVRLVVAAGLGTVVFALAMTLSPWQVAVLIGWDAASTVVVVWVLTATWTKTSADTARLATREDDSRAAADVMITSAAVASLVAVGFGLVEAADQRGFTRGAVTALAVASVALSWAAVQAIFMLRYARLYYSEGGGIDFNEDAAPDYRDFAYLAVTIGMTYQVSDTDLTSKPLRRAATRHSLLSYLFGTVIVAMMINVVAGLVR